METNYYKLLELEPTVKDANTIVATANKKIAEWNSYVTNPKKKLLVPGMVASFKKIIEEVGKNPQILEKHAAEFIKLQIEEKREQEKAIRDSSSMLVVNGEIDEATLDSLVKKHSQYSKADILKILGARIKQKRAFSYVDDGVQELERSTFNNIVSNLETVNKIDLYDFLGLKPTSSAQEIETNRKKIYNDNSSNTNITPQKTATGDLCGLVSSVLGDENKRKSYHKSLDNLVFTDIFAKIDQATLTNKIINPDQYKILLDDCAKKRIAKDKAEYYIFKHCEKKNVVIVEPSGSDFADQVTCRICSASNTPQSTVCKECAFPLVVACPGCGRKSSDPKELKCTQCGFSFGDMPNAETELIQVEKALITGNFNEAKSHLAKAESFWKTYPKIADFKKRLNDIQTEIDTSVKKLDDYKKEKKYCTLKDFINRQKISALIAAPYIAEADNAINKAKAECAKANTQSNPSAKLEMFLQALLICADLKEAEDELAKNPPQTPANFKVAAAGKKIQLSWERLPSNSIQYSIVRKEDGKPANHTDGTVIASNLANSNYDDIKIEPGRSYYYAVYSHCASIYSKVGAVNAEPVIVIQEIENIVAVPSDKEINFTFTLPDNARKKAEAEIYRDGNLIKTVSGGVFTDSGLVTEKQYNYKFVAVFTDCLNKKHHSAGIQTQVTPTSPPKPVALKVDEAKSDKNVQIITWAPPAKGTVVLYLCDQKQKFLDGQTIDVKSFTGKFTNPGTANNTVRVDLNFHGIKYLYPVTGSSGIYVVGTPLSIQSTQPVAAAFNLQGQQIDLKWEWNSNVQAVEIMSQVDQNKGSWKLIQSSQEPAYKVSMPKEKEAQSITVKIRNYQQTPDGTIILSEETSQTFALRSAAVDFVEVSGGGFFSKSEFKITLQASVPIPCNLNVLIGEGKVPLTNYAPHLTISQKELLGGKPLTCSLKYTRNDKSKPLTFRIVPEDKSYSDRVVITPEMRQIK